MKLYHFVAWIGAVIVASHVTTIHLEGGNPWPHNEAPSNNSPVGEPNDTDFASDPD
jgi:hypothetical protein